MTPELERIARMESYLDDVTTLTTKMQAQLDAVSWTCSHPDCSSILARMI